CLCEVQVRPEPPHDLAVLATDDEVTARAFSSLNPEIVLDHQVFFVLDRPAYTQRDPASAWLRWLHHRWLHCWLQAAATRPALPSHRHCGAWHAICERSGRGFLL